MHNGDGRQAAERRLREIYEEAQRIEQHLAEEQITAAFYGVLHGEPVQEPVQASAERLDQEPPPQQSAPQESASPPPVDSRIRPPVQFPDARVHTVPVPPPPAGDDPWSQAQDAKNWEWYRKEYNRVSGLAGVAWRENYEKGRENRLGAVKVPFWGTGLRSPKDERGQSYWMAPGWMRWIWILAVLALGQCINVANSAEYDPSASERTLAHVVAVISVLLVIIPSVVLAIRHVWLLHTQDVRFAGKLAWMVAAAYGIYSVTVKPVVNHHENRIADKVAGRLK